MAELIFWALVGFVALVFAGWAVIFTILAVGALACAVLVRFIIWIEWIVEKKL